VASQPSLAHSRYAGPWQPCWRRATQSSSKQSGSLHACNLPAGPQTYHNQSQKKKGQTQCQRLPHEWGLGKGITEAKSYPHRNSVERRLRTQDLATRRASTHQLYQACPSPDNQSQKQGKKLLTPDATLVTLVSWRQTTSALADRITSRTELNRALLLRPQAFQTRVAEGFMSNIF
jgi:hypothetical protein